jgi:glutamate formiminotransferase/formiminotetrahydrofolate cyclodeaminase
MKPFVECVPNFSEGRRLDVVAEIVGVMRTVSGVRVIDVQSDVDHNRSVVTLVGMPTAVQEAVFLGTAKAAALIDMTRHRGEHPRLGATDVIPFVPLSGVTMEECVTLARELGQRVGDELDIPVYLYEAAATRPDRVNLEDIRRGEYELLKLEIDKKPERAPDFGPLVLGPAGATVIGARPYLVAFNVYLNTADVTVARRIARAVRFSSGGYRFIKALGMLVTGQAQVSMNFTDFTRTPIYRVVETIRREAARYGATITHTELVGLAPQQALLDAAQWYLQLDRFSPDQILENKLAALDEGTPLGFVDAVAAKNATPGGGAVAALAGALGAALTAMVGRLTVGKRRYADVVAEVSEVIVEAERLRAGLAAQVDEDSMAFQAVMAAYQLPQTTEEEKAQRQTVVHEALIRAAEVPLATAQDALDVMDLALTVARLGNVHAVADAATAAWMAMAAIQSAALNVRTNAVSLGDEARQRAWSTELRNIVTRAESVLAQVQETAVTRGGL